MLPAADFRIHLHSSMERLKVISLSKYAAAHGNLHSSMERLKAAAEAAGQPDARIYIPVWRD